MKQATLILLFSFFTLVSTQDQEQRPKNFLSEPILLKCQSPALPLDALLVKNIDRFLLRVFLLPKNIFSVLAPGTILYQYKLLNNTDQTRDAWAIFISSLLTDFFLSGASGSARELLHQFWCNCKDVALTLLIMVTSLDRGLNHVKAILMSLLFAREIAVFSGDMLCYAFQKLV